MTVNFLKILNICLYIIKACRTHVNEQYFGSLGILCTRELVQIENTCVHMRQSFT